VQTPQDGHENEIGTQEGRDVVLTSILISCRIFNPHFFNAGEEGGGFDALELHGGDE